VLRIVERLALKNSKHLWTFIHS